MVRSPYIISLAFFAFVNVGIMYEKERKGHTKRRLSLNYKEVPHVENTT